MESFLKEVRIDDHRGSDYAGATELVVTSSGKSSDESHCRLEEGMSEDAIMAEMSNCGGISNSLMRDIVHDMLQHCGDGARGYKYSQAGAEAFVQRWSMKAFRDMLAAYSLSAKLPMDRAIQVLTEYYVIEPIMEA